MIDILKKAAYEAGVVALGYFRQKMELQYKDGHKQILTEADTASQKKIQEVIGESISKLGIDLSEVGFIGEENLDTKGEHLFVIDPIDGTTNFAAGIEFFAISIAYIREDQVRAGVVYVPYSNTYYFAEEGLGAWKDFDGVKTRLEIEPVEPKHALLNGQINSGVEAWQARMYGQLTPQVRSFRSLGSVTLSGCLIADNTMQILINGRAMVWDLAAVYLILIEAGATVWDWKGDDLRLDFSDVKRPYQVIVASKGLAEFALEAVKKTKDE